MGLKGDIVVHLLQVGQLFKHPRGLQGDDLIIVQAPEETQKKKMNEG